MSTPLFLAILFIVGYLLKFVKGIPKDLYQKINTFIIFLPLPAITLTAIPKLKFTGAVAFPILSAWAIFLGAIPFFYLLKRLFNWSKETFACLVLVCGLGNTAFIGLPIVDILFGRENRLYAVVIDQSTFVVLSTLGVIWAGLFGGSKINIKSIIWRLIKFPPFIVFIIAIFLNENSLATIDGELTFLGNLMVPLAILSIGMQFKILVSQIDYKAFALGLVYKLLFMPTIFFVLIFIILNKEGILYNVTFIECVMPPMITASIIANQYKLDGQLANALVTYGIPISFGTTALWMFALNHL